MSKASIVVRRAVVASLLASAGCVPPGDSAESSGGRDLPGLEEVLASRRDLWGEAAVRQENGASYEFFEPLLPPLRYVHAEFRQYPVILSSPGGPEKLRVASNGAGIELSANAPMWWDGSCPVAFFVGKEHEPFGSDLERLDGPHWREGWLPVLENRYRTGEALIEETVFASVRMRGGGGQDLFVRFRLIAGDWARVVARVGAGGSEFPSRVWRDLAWRFDPNSGEFVAELVPDSSATLVVFARDDSGHGLIGNRLFERELSSCIRAWNELLERGLVLETPEPRVNEAARAQLAGIFLLANGSELRYSARNGYERTFEAECGDAALALAAWGFQDPGRFVRALLERPLQEGIPNSDRAFQLQLLVQHHRLWRDPGFLESMRGHWQGAADALVAAREPGSGLLPRENYCGDVARQVYGLCTNASAWRALRDLSALLAELGQAQEAERYAAAARELRAAIGSAVERSVRREVDPPFVPNALLGEEEPHLPLTASLEGSYWNLLAPFTLASGVFGPGDERADWIVRTIRERGGLCMGLVRFDQHSGLYANERGLDDLYTLRYALSCLDRDEPEQALVSFYGKLAQGMTRGTLISAEGTGLVPEDRWGRPMYLPPVITGNAFFLLLLRHLLVHEQDLDDDGRPETLLLLCGTPRRWLADGARLRLALAPSVFGELGLELESHLAQGSVVARITPPAQLPARMWLRFRLPEGWEPTGASIAGEPVQLDEQGDVDITGRTQPFEVICRVERAR